MYHLCPVFSIGKVNAEKGYEAEMGSTSGDGGLHPGHMPAGTVTVSLLDRPGHLPGPGQGPRPLAHVFYPPHLHSPPLPQRLSSWLRPRLSDFFRLLLFQCLALNVRNGSSCGCLVKCKQID